MEIKKVLIISKTTELEMGELAYGSAVEEHYRRKHIDISALEENHKYHYDSLEKVVKAFQSQGITPGVRERQNIAKSDFKQKWDLIVPVGGDGTLMDAARYLTDDTLLFGIKSSPHSVGGHYSTNFSNAEEHIRKLISGEFEIEKRARIQGIIQNEFTIEDLALNDILISDLYSSGLSAIQVYLDGRWTKVGSSGILISTYKGADGWYNNIKVDGEGYEFGSGEENVLRYKFRDLNKKVSDEKAKDSGIIMPGEELLIISNMVADGKAIFDGNKPTKPRHRVYDFEYGNTLKIRLSDKPLYIATVK